MVNNKVSDPIPDSCISSIRANGFTLVELSIILVIIGLLAGGILLGRDLIRQSEVRSALSDMERFSTAINSFQSKYNCLPGDCANATQFFGQDTSATACTAGDTTPSVSGTCNGNGDGMIGQYNETAGADTIQAAESFRAWQQLALAQIIPGSYTGVPGAQSTYYRQTLIGTNVPASKLANAGYTIYYFNITDELSGTWPMQDHYFIFGSQQDSFFGTLYEPTGPILTGAEALGMDSKVDDGSPGTGRIMSFYNNYVNPLCAKDATHYNTASTTAQCSLLFKAM